MNNIYIFGITSAKGGIELLVNNIIKSAITNHQNTKVHIVTSFQKISFEDFYIKSGVDIIKIPNRKNKKEYKKALNELISSVKPDDTLYVNVSTYCNWTLFRAAKKANCRVIVHGHNAHTSNVFKKVLHFFGKRVFSKIGYKIAVSEECNKFMFNNKADVIINNGIDSKKYSFNLNDRLLVRSEMNCDHNRILVGCIGRISKEKNQLFLVKKAQDYPDLLFVFIGGFMNQEYEKRIKKSSPENCIFLGEKSDIGKYLSTLDAIVLPSKHEGFPLSAAEALTNGLPVFYLRKLYNNLPISIRNNSNSFIFSKDYFSNSFLSDINNLRNKGEVNSIDTYDVSYFLTKIERVLYE